MSKLNENRLILAVITFLFLLIPLTSYLMIQKAEFEHLIDPRFTTPKQSSFPEINVPQTNANSLQEMKNNIASLPSATPGFIMDGEPAVLSAEASSSGLKLRVKMDERPVNNQATELFVGIGQGEAQANPKYVLSFLVDLDESGQYSGISLTGLDPNSIYTAYIKGVSQLATTREFTYHPGLIDLGLIPLISGDVNEDNIIDQNDLLLVKQSIGLTPKSPDFDSALDVNNDGVINGLDLSIVNQNMGKTGEAGVIIPDNMTASTAHGIQQSATLETDLDTGSPEASSSAKDGYWLWIPKLN